MFLRSQRRLFMKKSPLLPYLDDETFLKLVEETLDIGIQALLKPEKSFDKTLLIHFPCSLNQQVLA